jgi:PhnB protein
MLTQPYLNFDGRCEEALDFYKQAVGAKVTMLVRFKESPEPPSADCGGGPENGDKVMHSAFHIGESLLMATDGYNKGQTEFRGFSLSLTVNSEEEVKTYVDALANGGQVEMAPVKTHFAKSFGMVSDRFGVRWMVIAPMPM